MIVAGVIVLGYGALIAEHGMVGVGAAAIHLGLLAVASTVRLVRRR